MDEGFDPAGVAVFIAAVSGVTALSCTRADQWGLRRLALGVCISSAFVAAMLLSPSVWWFGGILWGLHQIYLGWSYVSRKRRTTHERLEYLESSASVLAYVALADGAIGLREAIVIRETYARAGYSTQDLHEVDRILQQCERRFFADGSDPERLFVLLRDSCAMVMRHSNEQTRFIFLRAAVVIATSDGFVASGEERALRAAANWLGISARDYERLWRSVLDVESDDSEPSGPYTSPQDSEDGTREEPVVPPDLATYYASILGIALTASPQEIKRAYREKAKQYHPDVMAHRGPVFAREAEEKFKELSEAYAFFRGSAAAT